MLGCVLRVQSKTRDVETLLKASGLKPIVVFRKGKPRAPGRSNVNRQSGFNVDVSRGDGVLERQVLDAVRFLRRHAGGVSRLRRHEQCGRMTLDFGIFDRTTEETPWPSFHLPASLIELAGKHRIDIELSFYGPGSLKPANRRLQPTAAV